MLVVSEIDVLDLDWTSTSWTVVGKIDVFGFDGSATSLAGSLVAFFFVTFPFESVGGSAR